jgi:hypothetical protein
MSIITKALVQTATYWAPTTHDGYGGRAFSSPAAIACRWEDKQDKVVDSKGAEIQSSAQVMVAQDVAPGGYLYFGTSSGADPRQVSGAREIKAFEKIPNLRATEYLRKAYL